MTAAAVADDLRRFRALRGLAWRASGRAAWPAAIGHLSEARDMFPPGHAGRRGPDRTIAVLRARAGEDGHG